MHISFNSVSLATMMNKGSVGFALYHNANYEPRRDSAPIQWIYGWGVRNGCTNFKEITEQYHQLFTLQTNCSSTTPETRRQQKSRPQDLLSPAGTQASTGQGSLRSRLTDMKHQHRKHQQESRGGGSRLHLSRWGLFAKVL